MNESATPKRILVRAPNWIGDQVLAYPFFYFLRKNNPSAKITVACVEWVAALQFKNLVDDVIVLPQNRTKKFLERFKILRQSIVLLKEYQKKKGAWDLAISLPNSFSSAWLLRWSGAKIRRGYSTDLRGFLLNSRVDWQRGSRAGAREHRAQAYLNLLPEGLQSVAARDFWSRPAENELDPFIQGELDYFDAKSEWNSAQLAEVPKGNFWILAPGATADSRRWPLERFKNFAALVHSQTGWEGFVVGGPSEAPLAQMLCSDRTLKLRDLTARVPLTGLYPLFQKAQFALTNESGLAHVSALCGCFTQIVCGAADPRRTRPLGPGKVQVALNPVSCWPCERNTCLQPREQYLQCLMGLEPEAVWKEVQRGLGKS